MTTLFEIAVLHFSHLMYLPSSAVIGEIDEEVDASIDLSDIRADPLNSVVY